MRILARFLPLLALVLLPAALASSADPPPPESVRWPSAIGEVLFSHAAHVDDYGLECAQCHHETRAAPLVSPHPAYLRDFWVDCAACHRDAAAPAAAQACSACHPAGAARAVEEVSSSKIVLHASCWSCHDPGTGAAASAQCVFCHQGERRPPAADRNGARKP
jgi:hypothetical protein